MQILPEEEMSFLPHLIKIKIKIMLQRNYTFCIFLIAIIYFRRLLLQCREIGYETHEEILRVLHELHTTMKTYQAYQAESRQAETKLRVAEQQRNKLEVANADSREKLARSKKYKLIEKEVNKVSL